MDVQELARAIRTVHGGQPYLHPEATRQLLQATARPDPSPERLTNRQIADALMISEKTVSVHISNVLSKLGLASRTQAALYAARIGLIPPGELA